jgi:hypothetical protein
MKARDAPMIAQISAPQIAPFVTRHEAPAIPALSTRHEPPVKSSELMTKRASVTSHKRPRKPSQKAAKKPPSTPGFFFRKNGAGWDLRRDTYVTSHDGLRKRKQPYVAHLSREAFAEMKRQYKGAALESAIAQWIAGHDQQKGN